MRFLILPAAAGLLTTCSCRPAVPPERANPANRDAAKAQERPQEDAAHSGHSSIRMVFRHDENVSAIAWSPDGKTVASAAGDRRLGVSVKLWDVASGGNIVRFPLHVMVTHLEW